jgi:hypothetical protein
MASEIKVDTISEKTSAGGVTIDSVKLKDGGIVISDAANIGSASDTDALAISSGGVVTFSQNPVFPDGGVAIADLDIDGATDIGAAIVDADLFIIDDGAGGTNRKTTASRLKTYAGFTATTITGETALAAQPASDDEIIISDGGTLKRLDIKHISNTPAFHVRLSGDQSLNNTTQTKLSFATEELDSDSAFASNKWTPGVAGRYFIYYHIRGLDVFDDGEYLQGFLFKNGSEYANEQGFHRGYSPASNQTIAVSNSLIVQLDGDDYIELYGHHNEGAAANIDASSTFFGGFRLTGMES